MHFMERRKVALFVDFDNVFSGLVERAPLAADRFGANPGQWLRWLEDGMPASFGEGGRLERSILVRKCYMNPQRYEKYRNGFATAGFSVVDCPPLTGLGKTGADMLMVLEIMDALQRDLYEEFIIFSGDADFTPVLLRLRAHDRRTAVVVTGKYARAMRGATDALIDSDVFIRFALEMQETPAAPLRAPEPAPRPAASTPAPEPSPRPAAPPAAAPAPAGNGRAVPGYVPSGEELAIVEYIRQIVVEEGKPLSLAALGGRVRAEFASVVETSWFKAGGFGKWLHKQPFLPFEVYRRNGDAFIRPRHRPASAHRGTPSAVRTESPPARTAAPAEPVVREAAPALLAAIPTPPLAAEAAPPRPAEVEATAAALPAPPQEPAPARDEADASPVLRVDGFGAVSFDGPAAPDQVEVESTSLVQPSAEAGPEPLRLDADTPAAGARADDVAAAAEAPSSGTPALPEPLVADAETAAGSTNYAWDPHAREADPDPVSGEPPCTLPLSLHVVASELPAEADAFSFAPPPLGEEPLDLHHFLLDSPVEERTPGADFATEGVALEVERAGCAACGAALRPGYERCLACGTVN